MKYPCLVNKRFCTTPISISVDTEGIDEDGAPIAAFQADEKCNYQECAKTVLTADKKLVQITATALFCGDLAPALKTISGGTVTVYGIERRILQGTKARNPDGTVNFTRLDLI